MLMFPSKTQAIVNWAYKKHSLELINKQRIIPNMTGDAIYEQNGKIMRRFGYYLHMRCPKHFTNWMHRGRYNRHSNATFTLSHYFINRHSILAACSFQLHRITFMSVEWCIRISSSFGSLPILATENEIHSFFCYRKCVKR